MSAEERLALQRIWWDTPWFWIMVAAILCGTSLVGISYRLEKKCNDFNSMQSEAIKRGYAEWRDDGKGTPIFKWVEKRTLAGPSPERE